MCGIIGYTGNDRALPRLIAGLKTLEYRGYDSAGISVFADGILTVKTKGRIADLEKKLENISDGGAVCGIGHTRWATHGEPADRNSHPHGTERLSLVHNGIIENYAQLGDELRADGYIFRSETDTEVAAFLIDKYYIETKDPIKAISSAVKRMRGSFSFAIMFADHPGNIYATRRDNPLIVAKSDGASVLASDIPAVLAYTKTYFRLDEGVIATLSKDGVTFVTLDGEPIEQKTETVDWDVSQAKKGGYDHFMIKEINEEPTVLHKTVASRLENGLPHFGIDIIDGFVPGSFSAIHIVACGSAMHAGLVGRTIIEKLARIPVSVEIASEFRYRDPILTKRDIVILISQSGETADTVAALRHAKEKGAYTLAIVNVIGSTVAREADGVIYTWAGPEIAVATTKAYTVQCAILYMLAIRLGMGMGTVDEKTAESHCRTLMNSIPERIERVLDMDYGIKQISRQIVTADHVFYIGRKIDWDVCVEASLKLKEISYIHSEAYAAGELKHGTISLITEGTPVIAVITQDDICEKTISGMREVKARGAYVIAVCADDIASKYEIPCDELIRVPQTDELFSPLVAVTVIQLLAYHVSALKGIDVDKPRNLAKSVTVE